MGLSRPIFNTRAKYINVLKYNISDICVKWEFTLPCFEDFLTTIKLEPIMKRFLVGYNLVKNPKFSKSFLRQEITLLGIFHSNICIRSPGRREISLFNLRPFWAQGQNMKRFGPFCTSISLSLYLSNWPPRPPSVIIIGRRCSVPGSYARGELCSVLMKGDL